ncbi:YceI family protein [Novilysobacter erysipheiresistens]|uniref:YceI family protein n=1 Tax=Novilysobacter erysipheiresistens TaxID=1749332 RepID=A0ABU7YZQ0_9GAMM
MFKQLILTAALAAASTAAFAEPVTYKIDPSHTNVIAQWNHFGFSNPSAHFGQAEGTLVYDADNVAASSVQVTLPLTGLDSFSAKFDEHLRSADFFEVAEFPVATFESTQVEAVGEGKLKVTGNLTIKDITKPVVLDVTLNKVGVHMNKQPAIGFDATTTVKRSDFDLGMAAPMVSDEVEIRITTEASVPKDT